MLGDVNKLFVFKNPLECFAFTPQVNFPVHIWIFTEAEDDGIKSRLPFNIFSTLIQTNNCHSIKVHRAKTRINWNPPLYINFSTTSFYSHKTTFTMRTFKCIKDLGWGILILADLILLQMCPKNKHKNNNATSKKISPYCARHKPNNWQHPTNTRELELSSKKAGNMGLTFMFCSRVSKYQE